MQDMREDRIGKESNRKKEVKERQKILFLIDKRRAGRDIRREIEEV